VNEDRPHLIIVPTELERQDAFYDAAVLGFTVLAVWQLALYGLLLWSLPALVLVLVWMLTGEPAADVPFVGAIASGLRSKIGLRRAHEWLLAWMHYVNLVHAPVWRAFADEWRERTWFWTLHGCRECWEQRERPQDRRGSPNYALTGNVVSHDGRPTVHPALGALG